MRSPPQNIVIGIDFSDASHAALSYARDLARCTGGKLTLVHVLDITPYAAAGPIFGGMPMPPVLPVDVQGARAEAERALRAVADEHAPGAAVEVLSGNPADELCARAKSADLLVVGTHGKGGLRHLLVGSTAEHVMRRSPTPVLTVRVP